MQPSSSLETVDYAAVEERLIRQLAEANGLTYEQWCAAYGYEHMLLRQMLSEGTLNMEGKLEARDESTVMKARAEGGDNRKARRAEAAVERRTLDEIDSTIDRKVAVIVGDKPGKTAAMLAAASPGAVVLATGAIMDTIGEAVADQITAPMKGFMTGGTIPDHVSINPKSKFYFEGYRGLGVKVSGFDRKGDVEEFCVAEGWAKVRVHDRNGRFKTERGKYITTTIKGIIEPYWK